MHGAWIFYTIFFFCCPLSRPPSLYSLSLAETSSSLRVFTFSDKKMYCYLLVYCISRLNSIRTQEIVQVTLSFNLIKAQQDYYYYRHYCNHEDLHGTQFFSLCSCWWWSCCIRWLKWKENALEKECSFFHLPTCRTFSTQFDSSNLSPLQKLKFCVSPAFVDETLWRRKKEKCTKWNLIRLLIWKLYVYIKQTYLVSKKIPLVYRTRTPIRHRLFTSCYKIHLKLNAELCEL